MTTHRYIWKSSRFAAEHTCKMAHAPQSATHTGTASIPIKLVSRGLGDVLFRAQHQLLIVVSRRLFLASRAISDGPDPSVHGVTAA